MIKHDAMTYDFLIKYDYRKTYRKVSEIDADKAFAERIGYNEGWSTCNPVVRNLRPTEEEKRRFLKRYGKK